ncbi:MAG: acetoacetate decarboxylase [Gammaproteobacteria bacterium]|nr:acetoacetate decarboxylase [Gammaproteobacteria bacterium]
MKLPHKMFNMPEEQGNPAYTEAPNVFFNREYFIVTYETEREAIDKALPHGLTAPEPLVKFEFMKMPDATGFGAFQEAGQAIPVVYKNKKTPESGLYVYRMFLSQDCLEPTVGGREIWGFPKKTGTPNLAVDGDTLVGTLDYGKVRIATATMGYKFNTINKDKIKKALGEPGYLLKTIPHVDGTPAICQLVKYRMTNISVKWAYSGPATLELHPHALAPIADLPVKKIISAVHILADLTLPYGEVLIDYLKK